MNLKESVCGSWSACQATFSGYLLADQETTEMTHSELPDPENAGSPGLRINVRNRRVHAKSIIVGTLRRMIRFPAATLTGAAMAIASHLLISYALDANTDLLGIVFAQMTVGVAEFLSLSTFMVADEERLSHLHRLLRVGMALSLGVAAVALVPIALIGATVPESWLASHFFRDLTALWPYAAHGFGVAALLIVLPAFPLLWSISANTGANLYKSVVFVWSAADGNAYSGPVMAATLALTAWLLVTIPPLGLFVPIFFAHTSAYLFHELIDVQNDSSRP
jgi:hypothetical protein